MQIVEPDFILSSCGGLFNLTFYKKVKNKETGEVEVKSYTAAWGCSLSSALNRIVKHRLKSIYNSESPCLLEALNKIIELQKEIISLCKDSLPEDFDSGE